MTKSTELFLTPEECIFITLTNKLIEVLISLTIALDVATAFIPKLRFYRLCRERKKKKKRLKLFSALIPD